MNRRHNSLTKCTRIERLAQLSEQEIVIERKKKEIQAKIEAQKKKETEEALKKLESSHESKTKNSSFTTKPIWKRHDFWKTADREKEKEKEKKIEDVKPSAPLNAFSNDGSFLDQFKKLSSTGLKPNNVDIETLAKARKKDEEKDRGKKAENKTDDRDKDVNVHRQRRDSDRKDDFCRDREREREREDSRFSDSSRRSPSRKPLDSNIQLQLPPPGVVQLVPQHQVQIVTPQIVSVVQSLPVVQSVQRPPVQPVQNQISLVSPSAVQVPVLQPVVLNPIASITTVPTIPPPPVSVPTFTTNQIQLQANFSSPNYVTESPQLIPSVCPPPVLAGATSSVEVVPPEVPPYTSPRSVSSPPQHLASIRPPLPMTPQNIPPPSPIQVQNIPPPPLPPKKSEESQKIHIGNIFMSLKKKKEIENLPNPLDLMEIPAPTSSKGGINQFDKDKKKKKKKRKPEELSVSGCSPPPPGYFDSIPLPESIPVPDEPPRQSERVSPALSDDEDGDDNELEEGKRHLAAMVARCGDDVENILRIRNQDDPALRFLFEENSKNYKLYRKLVEKYRKHPELIEEDESEKSSDRSNSSRIYQPDSEDDEPAEKKERRDSSSESEKSDADSNTRDSIDVNFKISSEDFQLEKDTTLLQEEEKEKESIFCKTTNDEGDMEESIKRDDAHYNPDKSGSSEVVSDEISAKHTYDAPEIGETNKTEERKRKRKSRWGEVATDITTPLPVPNVNVQLPPNIQPRVHPAPKIPLLSKVTRSDPGLLQYARKTFGSINLSEEDWKKAEDHYKINLLYQDMVKKRAELAKLEKAGKFKYEYDSDEDTEGGTWEHKLRQQEMEATQLWAEELTRQAAGKHHIGDFLPPEELERFMERYNAVKEGREPDLSDYKEFKLKDDNVGYRLLQKMGWNEGEGLGQDGSGIIHPVNKATTRHENQGLGIDRPDGIEAGDDEYDAYRKRMMLAYRFRPNPLNNPRRPYY